MKLLNTPSIFHFSYKSLPLDDEINLLIILTHYFIRNNDIEFIKFNNFHFPLNFAQHASIRKYHIFSSLEYEIRMKRLVRNISIHDDVVYLLKLHLD